MKRLLSCSAIILIGLAGCNISTPRATPTPVILASSTPNMATSLPSPTASITATEPRDAVVPVVISSPIPTQSGPPAIVIPPTNTPGPCEVTIQEGETLTAALLREACGNLVVPSLIDTVVRFNENISNADFVSQGITFFVPRPTPTPIPPGADMTATYAAGLKLSVVGDQSYPAGTQFGCHEIVEGETLLAVADIYNATLEQLSQLNQEIIWQGCDFTNPSGGPNCNPIIRAGQCVSVPLPTSTPVPTATPSGRETVTATPTHSPVRAVSPGEGFVASGRVVLEWVSVGILQVGENYLVEIVDDTTQIQEAFVTDKTRYTLPSRLTPADGQQHKISWRISVATSNLDGSYTRVGGAGRWNTFAWQNA